MILSVKSGIRSTTEFGFDLSTNTPALNVNLVQNRIPFGIY